MKLSEKKKKEISSMANAIFYETLKEHSLKYSNDNWFDQAPDTWNREETKLFDALSDLQQKFVIGIESLLTK